MDNRGSQGSFLRSLHPRRSGAHSAKTEIMDGQHDSKHFEDSTSDTTQEQDISISESESGATSPIPKNFGFLGDGLIRLEDGDKNYKHLKHIFLSGLGDLQNHATVEAVHGIAYSSLLRKARMETFQIYLDAMAKRQGVGANMKYAWYASTRAGISEIVQYGFGQFEDPENGSMYGCGLYLSPAGSSIESVLSSTADENGLRHLLLCRVLLGKQEEVFPGSKQFHPTTEEFDSGVDNFLAPKRYVVWSTNMNTHVLPVYILSFCIPSFPRGFQSVAKPVRMPSSPWMPLSKLVSVLSGSLPPPAINLIKRYHTGYMKKRITRENLIRHLRRIAGDRLLLASIKSFRERMGRQHSAKQIKKEMQ